MTDPAIPVLPAWPALRPDAQVVAHPMRPLRIALSAELLVSIPGPPEGLAEWIASLDGLRHRDEVLASAPLPEDLAQHLLAELDLAGLLIDADRGRPFRDPSAQERDSLLLASQARAGRRRPAVQPPPQARLWVAGGDPWRSGLAAALRGCAEVATPTSGMPAELMVIMCSAFDPVLEQLAERASALALPHVAVVVSAVDALFSPLIIPAATACQRCWWVGREAATEDWNTWSFRGRSPAAPRLPAHHRAMVVGLAVEHALTAIEVLQGRLPSVRAARERRLDLRRGTVALQSVDRLLACDCRAAA